MSIFGKIRDSIFGKKPKPQKAPVAPPESTARPQPTGNAWADAPVVEQKAKPVIDIENNLDNMPGAGTLNWRTSIVDLMKLIGVDSDYESRKALAVEMGREDYSGSTEDNIWLHRRVMNELAANGGKVPTELLD